MKRIVWIDYAKTVAIYAVLIIHTHCNVGVVKICNAVALPLFFFISGYLFSFERHRQFRKFLYKRFRQLIIPYLWINLVAYLFWIAIGRHFGEDAASGLTWHEPLVGVLLGIGPQLTHDIPLWSLLSFFIVEIIYFLTYRLFSRNGFWLSFFFVASWLTGTFDEYTYALPLTLGPVMAGLVFYIAGQYCRLHNTIIKVSRHLNPLLMVTVLGLFIVLCDINSGVNFYICQYGNFLLFIAAAIAGIAGIIMLCLKIGGWIGDRKIINTISVGTLLICGFHLMVYSFLKGVGYFILHISPSEMVAGPVRGLLFAFAGLLLCIPIVIFIQKYLRILTDK